MEYYRPLADVAVLFLPLLMAWLLKNHFVSTDESSTE
jgi:hypothetical protein